MKKTIQSLVALATLLFCTVALNAQMTISGTISDKNGGLPGVSVVVKGTTTGAQTDGDGKFSFTAPKGATTLVISSVGYTSQEIAIPASGVVNVTLADSDNVLGEVVISTGSRNTQRTVTDTPLPIDILGASDLKMTGQTSFDKALQYRVPSFNSVNTPVNDATTLLDPWEIRNMGPSRTLILINGKRKNLSSLLYVQFSPGRGETGVDLSAIPQDAIKRVEILRDGASAQYGSDAIAGVMNVILKDKYDYTTLNINMGTTTSKGNAVATPIPGNGYGGNYSVALNSGTNLGGKGYINYTVDLSQSNSIVRSGIVDIPTEIATFGDGAGGAQDQLIKAYLKDYPTGNNINGSGEITAAKFLVNGGFKIGDNSEIYANAAMVKKRVLSYANFRQPYWRQDRGLLHKATDNGGKNYITAATLAFSEDAVDLYKGYIGYVPTFEGDLSDYNATIGARNETNGWKSDLSLTVGGNQQSYTVDNTVNRTLGKASPTRFKPGGFGFKHTVGNIDISKNVTDKFGIAFGAEARSESFTIVAGDTASYSGEGANSFPGLNATNAGTNSRFNIGAYVDLSYDINEDFMINATGRTEKYSDFGNANVWKISSRYKLADDKVTLRASASTGFRAPSLHQIYAQSVQASFVNGFIQLAGLFNNRSAQARALGIDALRPEKSTNITVGAGLNPMKNLSITLDYFSINVKDRIVYSSSISSSSATSTLGKILTNAGVRNISFFINGIETNTSGLDYVVAYRNIPLGAGKLTANLAGNFILKNEIVGTPNDPAAIKSDNASILNAQIKSLLVESRPAYKSILGFDYSLDKWVVNLNNTLIGPTAFRDLDNGGGDMNYIKAVFKPAVVTDLSIGYSFNKKVSVTLNCNNLLNVLPKWDLEFNPITPGANPTGEAAAKATLADPAKKSLLRGFLGFSGRYDILGYNGSQFSQVGRMLNAQLSFKF
ncbi:MAG: TonB-dependent receptor [Saprospiraceae bacterium]|nr:TonB-dependent receptor [Saprospiraceae bacterium]